MRTRSWVAWGAGAQGQEMQVYSWLLAKDPSPRLWHLKGPPPPTPNLRHLTPTPL